MQGRIETDHGRACMLCARQSGSPRQQCIGVISAFVDSIDSHIILRMIRESKTNCVFRFYIRLKLQCNRLTTDLQDYHFHRCYTVLMCANIDIKATTGKQHKGEQFHKSSNGSAKNSKMAMYLMTSLEGWLGGLSKKRIVYVDFTLN